MSAAPSLRRVALGVGALLLAGGALACGEDFATGPQRFDATLDLRNWADTLVLGDLHPVGVRVIDDHGREVLSAAVTWTVATPTVLGPRLSSATTPSTTATLAAEGGDSVRLAALHTGTSDVVITLTDDRFNPVSLTAQAVVVVGGVRVATARDTTMVALGDTALVTGAALAMTGTGTTVGPRAGEGITWTRRGAGAVSLVGQGDSVRAIAQQTGTDTLIATHALCLASARCADTVVVHVGQTAQPLALGAQSYRVWSLGDSVAVQVLVQDARGNAIGGTRLDLVPLTAADSAVVGVNTAAGVPAFGRGVDGPAAVRSAVSLAGVEPLVIVALGLPDVPGLAIAPAVPLRAPPLVAQANGVANVLVRALASDGRLLGTDTISVIVRQIASVVQVTPAIAELTPGDSIPVAIVAHDARAHRILDATFQPVMIGAVYRTGRIIIPPDALAGQGTLDAIVTGVAAPASNPGAPIPNPAPDTARVIVRVPPPMAAGDTTSTVANTLTAALVGPDDRPLANAWVRFAVTGGTLVGVDSVQSDAQGLVHARWTLPTRAGTYTATAVVVTASTPSDTAGQIVLRRTVTVVAGAPAALTIVAGDGQSAAAGSSLPIAPRVRVADAYGNSTAAAGVAFTVATGGGTVGGGATQGTTTDASGDATAGAWVLGASAGANTLTAVTAGVPAVTFTATGTGSTAPPLAIAPATAEKRPNGTQQFAVNGAAGPYVWSVDGVDGGDAAHGSVDAGGLYTAPASVPSPATVSVCARLQSDAAVRACGAVTVSAQFTAGADVVVFNDMNVWGMTENTLLFSNLVDFAGSTLRASGRTVMFYSGGNSPCDFGNEICRPGGNLVGALQGQLTGLGYTVLGEHLSLAQIPADVKVVFLFAQTTVLPASYVNGLKQFASEGGRVVVVGEHLGYMGAGGIAAENLLLQRLGAQLTNQGANLLCIGEAPAVGTHPIVTGITQVWMACASSMTLGPNDVALFQIAGTNEVMGAVAKVDVTPLALDIAADVTQSTAVLRDTVLLDGWRTEATVTVRDASGALLTGNHLVTMEFPDPSPGVSRARLLEVINVGDGTFRFRIEAAGWGATPVLLRITIDGVELPTPLSLRVEPNFN